MRKIVLLFAVMVVSCSLYASTIMVDKNLSIITTKDQIIVLISRDASGKVVLEAPIKNDKYNEVQIRTKKLQLRVEKE